MRRSHPMSTVCASTVLTGLLLSGCTANDADSQMGMACFLVNDWPYTYSALWPGAVDRARFSGRPPSFELSKDYLMPMFDLMDLTDPNAIRVKERYLDYWVLLGNDYIESRESPTIDTPSTALLKQLFRECKKYDLDE